MILLPRRERFVTVKKIFQTKNIGKRVFKRCNSPTLSL